MDPNVFAFLSFIAGVVISAAVSYGANKGVAAAQAAVQAEVFRRLDSIDKKMERFDEDVRELHGLFTEICAKLMPWDGRTERRHERDT